MRAKKMNGVEKHAVTMMNSKLVETYSAIVDNRELIEDHTNFKDLDHTLDKMEELQDCLESLNKKGYGRKNER